MMDGLRRALRDEAEKARTYAVYDLAVATAKRRRRGRRAATAAGLAVLVMLLFSGLPGALVSHTLDPAVAPADGPSLPDRLGFPPAFYPGVKGNPSGPASVVFGGQGFPVSSVDQFLEDEGDLAVVGATSDIYRTWLVGGTEVHAGEEVVLSPDGSRLALRSGVHSMRAAIVDLNTGDVEELAGFGADDYVTPLAWSPDGTMLAVNVVGAAQQNSIGLVSVPDGDYRRISDINSAEMLRGFDFAFAPDGRRFAYQRGNQIVIADLDLRELGRFTVPANVWLAGKGAWTQDGASLVTVQQHEIGRLWQLIARDPATGKIREGLRWAAERDLVALRLVGWNPEGDPVVVAYQAEQRFLGDIPGNNQPETSYQVVHSVKVLRLTVGGGTETLLTTPHNIMSIDIADDVIASGRIRRGDPPQHGPLPVYVGLLILGAAAIVVGRLIRVRRRK